MSKVYRVAIIGTGMICNAAHIPAYKAMGDKVKIVAVADIREEAAKETAERHNIPKYYVDAYEMLEKEKPDIISVCTSNAYHVEYTLAGLRAGCDVFCEKPVAVKYTDAEMVFAEAEKLGKHLFVTQSLRFFKDYVAAADIVKSGALGNMYFADLHLVRRLGIPKWGMFHMAKENIGGAFCDIGVHMCDYLMSITGNPQMVSTTGKAVATLVNTMKDTYYSNVESGALSGDIFTPRKFDWKEFDVEEFSNGYIRFENGMTVTIKISWALNQPNQQTVSLCGDKGGLLLTDDSMKLITTQGRYQADLMPRIFEDKYEKLYNFYGHIHVFENALKVLDGEMTMEEYPIKKEEVMNVVSIIEAFYKSDKLGREVTFAELEK